MSHADPGGARRDAIGDADRAWRLCCALADARRNGALPMAGCSLSLDEGDRSGAPRLHETADAHDHADRVGAGGIWVPAGHWTPAARALLALYLPLLSIDGGHGFVVAHLGQSIDGRIATHDGDSRELNCPANLQHLHRLRALSDAVLIGRETAGHDDPQLTTRLVSGDNPVRVIIDPQVRLPSALRVFTDGQAPTLVVCAAEHEACAHDRFGRDRVLPVPAGDDGRLAPASIRAALAALGLHAVFIEGGGITVSRFIAARCADRLHVAVAPVLAGGGRDGLQLDGAALMCDNARPACRLFRMGSDVLWDFDLRTGAAVTAAAGNEESGVQLIEP